MVPKIYVIAGAPCTGKTSVIQELEKRGYKVIPEGAAEIGSTDQRFEGKLEREGDEFNRAIFEFRKKQIESLGDEDGIVFSDRGIGDSLAFYKLNSGKFPEDIFEYVKSIEYSGVFILEPLGFYEQNKKRWSPEEKQSEIQEILRSIYSGLGYDVVSVPVLPVKERVELILSKISA